MLERSSMKVPAVVAALTAAATCFAAPASARDIVVKMKNQGAGGAMVFEPAFVKAQPGDTVRLTARHRDSPICDEQSVTFRLDEADNSITGRLFGPTSAKTQRVTGGTYGRVDHSEEEYAALVPRQNFTTVLLAAATSVGGMQDVLQVQDVLPPTWDVAAASSTEIS